MARPKKVVEDSQGDEPTKIVQVKTEVKTVKVEPPKEKPLKDGDMYLVKADGVDTYMTSTMLQVALQRGVPDIEVPKGSPFKIPVNAKCSTCG